MRIFITRSGQPEDNGNIDLRLSDLGRTQARLLGERLKSEGFDGFIYSSTVASALETAEIISALVGGEVIPTPAFSTSQDGYEEIRYRTALAISDIMNKSSSDVLLIGHTESLDAICVYVTGEFEREPHFNCAYTLFDTSTKCFVRNDTSHLAALEMTYDQTPFLKNEVAIDLPDDILQDDGFLVLHMGDTPACSFDWYTSLVRLVNPDVIIHTGDTVDEMKVSRDPTVHDRYLDLAAAFLGELANNCKRLIWVPGNNDLPEKITELLPSIEYVADGSVISVEETSFSLAHDKRQLVDGSDVHLYGHSTRYDVWSPERNVSGNMPYYLNAYWHASVISLPSKKLYKISFPYKI